MMPINRCTRLLAVVRRLFRSGPCRPQASGYTLLFCKICVLSSPAPTQRQTLQLFGQGHFSSVQPAVVVQDGGASSLMRVTFLPVSTYYVR